MESFKQRDVKVSFMSSEELSGFSGENGLRGVRVAAGRPVGGFAAILGEWWWLWGIGKEWRDLR